MSASGFNKCLFNVHTPSYCHKYRRELASQDSYAKRHNYAYHSVGLDADAEKLRGFAKWHKLRCFLELFETYQIVLLLDCDCRVRGDAPDISREIVIGKTIYMARGHSGRYNSGVILAVDAPATREFFRAVLESRGQTLRAEHVVSADGENGHIIETANSPTFAPIIQELEYKWNNNSRPDQPDFIRHFSGGPMKAHFR